MFSPGDRRGRCSGRRQRGRARGSPGTLSWSRWRGSPSAGSGRGCLSRSTHARNAPPVTICTLSGIKYTGSQNHLLYSCFEILLSPSLTFEGMNPYLWPLRVCLLGVHAVVVCCPEPEEDAELVPPGLGQLPAGDHCLHDTVGACRQWLHLI